MRKLKKVSFWGVLGFISLIILSNIWVIFSTKNKVYREADAIESYDVGLVLGTSSKMMTGEENPFFRGRIDAAIELYKAGKVKYLIVSGDNASKYYNEPLKMQQALIDGGVPQGVITLDYAGFRTLDSIVRCKQVFGQQDVIIISQEFHCHRALFIGEYYDMNTIAYATKKIPFSISFRVLARELLARPFAIWDTYVIGKKPKYLGEKEELNRG